MRKLALLFMVVMVMALGLASCGPTPESQTVIQMVEVERTVVQAVEVERTIVETMEVEGTIFEFLTSP